MPVRPHQSKHDESAITLVIMGIISISFIFEARKIRLLPATGKAYLATRQNDQSQCSDSTDELHLAGTSRHCAKRLHCKKNWPRQVGNLPTWRGNYEKMPTWKNYRKLPNTLNAEHRWGKTNKVFSHTTNGCTMEIKQKYVAQFTNWDLTGKHHLKCNDLGSLAGSKTSSPLVDLNPHPVQHLPKKEELFDRL